MNKLMGSEVIDHVDTTSGSPVARAMGAIPAGLLMTMSLLYAMHYLIHNDYPVAIDDPVVTIPEFIMDTPPPIVTREDEPPVRPVEQQSPPPVNRFDPPEVSIDGDGMHFGGPVDIVKPPIKGAFGMGGQMVPFIKIAPQYPVAAASKGVEGYVDVMFDVTESGATDNIRIIGYVPSAVFNKSVIKAVKGWKYKPNEVDGVAVRTFDVKDRIRFAMEK
jgi:periplasmic protein TonB